MGRANAVGGDQGGAHQGTAASGEATPACAVNGDGRNCQNFHDTASLASELVASRVIHRIGICCPRTHLSSDLSTVAIRYLLRCLFVCATLRGLLFYIPYRYLNARERARRRCVRACVLATCVHACVLARASRRTRVDIHHSPVVCD